MNDPASRDASGPRLDPAAALMPGARDAALLIGLWLVRRSFFWMLFAGIALGAVIQWIAADANDIELDTSSAGAIAGGVLTPFGLAFLAIVSRFAANWAAYALTYPLARDYHARRSRPDRAPSRATAFFDRLLVARAMRAFRWTHDVRVEAFERLGRFEQPLALADRIIGVANIASAIVCVVVIFALSASIEA